MWILGGYTLAAVLPAAVLLIYVYQHDRVEREPTGLLGWLVTPGTLLHTVLTACLVVAAVEEGTKFFFLKQRTWYDYNFNYRFDAIVYAVFVSLGFAAFENIKYVFHFGLSVALPRAFLSIPGHMAFAVFMGVYYGRAKMRESRGYRMAVKADLAMAYIVSLLLHGFYDACAMIGTTGATILFIIFVVITYLRMFRLLKKEAAMDVPV